MQKHRNNCLYLKKAGVVDAGGQGLVLIFEGIQSVFENNAIVQPIDSEKKEEKQSNKSTVAAADEEIKFGYCSEFLIEKEKVQKKRTRLSSVLILNQSVTALWLLMTTILSRFMFTQIARAM